MIIFDVNGCENNTKILAFLLVVISYIRVGFVCSYLHMIVPFPFTELFLNQEYDVCLTMTYICSK